MLPVLPLQAQNATLTGVVTVRETGQSLPNVSVFLGGTGYGTITGPNGRYTISNVAPGTYNVVAQTLGYAEARSANVVLGRGAIVTVDFTLQMQPLKQSFWIGARLNPAHVGTLDTDDASGFLHLDGRNQGGLSSGTCKPLPLAIPLPPSCLPARSCRFVRIVSPR